MKDIENSIMYKEGNILKSRIEELNKKIKTASKEAKEFIEKDIRKYEYALRGENKVVNALMNSNIPMLILHDLNIVYKDRRVQIDFMLITRRNYYILECKNTYGNILIDKNSAVGILEEFKANHKDAKVTATFFVNGGIFNQSEYNEKILNWMIDNGYDIGNHTQTHLDIKKSSGERVQKEIAYVYDELERIIPNKYVKIIALPFGSPYVKTHENFKYVLNTTYNNKTYETEAALRVGWEPEVSCFNKDFDKTFLKRCRAYDNNGKEFDITMVFNNLKNNKYISDGNVKTITVPESSKNLISQDNTLEVITY